MRQVDDAAVTAALPVEFEFREIRTARAGAGHHKASRTIGREPAAARPRRESVAGGLKTPHPPRT